MNMVMENQVAVEPSPVKSAHGHHVNLLGKDQVTTEVATFGKCLYPQKLQSLRQNEISAEIASVKCT